MRRRPSLAGALAATDARRLADCFPSIDYFERRGTPFVVAVNCFDDAMTYSEPEVREALDLDVQVPLLLCDARDRGSSKAVLIGLVEHVVRLSSTPARA